MFDPAELPFHPNGAEGWGWRTWPQCPDMTPSFVGVVTSAGHSFMNFTFHVILLVLCVQFSWQRKTVTGDTHFLKNTNPQGEGGSDKDQKWEIRHL